MSDLLIVGAASSTVFMFLVVSVSALGAALIALSLISLKHRSTNRLTVFATISFLLGCIVANFAIGIEGINQAKPVLATLPGRIALGLVALGFVGAVVGMMQFALVPRYRRGKKRGIFTILLALAVAGLLYYSDYRTRHPKAPETSPTQELEIDPNQAVPRVISATPAARTETPARGPARPGSPQ